PPGRGGGASEPLVQPDVADVELERDRCGGRARGQAHPDVELLGQIEIEIEQIPVAARSRALRGPARPVRMHGVVVSGSQLRHSFVHIIAATNLSDRRPGIAGRESTPTPAPRRRRSPAGMAVVIVLTVTRITHDLQRCSTDWYTPAGRSGEGLGPTRRLTAREEFGEADVPGNSRTGGRIGR